MNMMIRPVMFGTTNRPTPQNKETPPKPGLERDQETGLWKDKDGNLFDDAGEPVVSTAKDEELSQYF